jgi:hypothetical protein
MEEHQKEKIELTWLFVQIACIIFLGIVFFSFSSFLYTNISFMFFWFYLFFGKSAILIPFYIFSALLVAPLLNLFLLGRRKEKSLILISFVISLVCLILVFSLNNYSTRDSSFQGIFQLFTLLYLIPLILFFFISIKDLAFQKSKTKIALFVLIMLLFSIVFTPIFLKIPENCAYVSNQERQHLSERDECYLRNLDCELITADWGKWDCFLNKAKELEEMDLCVKIEDEYRRNVCFMEIARIKLDLTLCNYLSENVQAPWEGTINMRQNCYSTIEKEMPLN